MFPVLSFKIISHVYEACRVRTVPSARALPQNVRTSLRVVPRRSVRDVQEPVPAIRHACGAGGCVLPMISGRTKVVIRYRLRCALQAQDLRLYLVGPDKGFISIKYVYLPSNVLPTLPTVLSPISSRRLSAGLTKNDQNAPSFLRLDYLHSSSGHHRLTTSHINSQN